MVQPAKSEYGRGYSFSFHMTTIAFFNKVTKKGICFSPSTEFVQLMIETCRSNTTYQLMKEGHYVSGLEIEQFCSDLSAKIPVNSSSQLFIWKIRKFLEMTPHPIDLFFMATDIDTVPYWAYLKHADLELWDREHTQQYLSEKHGLERQKEHGFFEYEMTDWNNKPHPLPMEYFFV